MAKTKRVAQSTNTITEGIINSILNDKWSASRINVQGQWDEERKIWRPSGSRRGFGDIAVCIKGRAIVIEVKFEEDKQNADQIEFQKEWERAGGIYLIIKTWFDWGLWYQNLKDNNYNFDA